MLDLQIKTDDPGLWGVTGTEVAVGHPLVPVPTVETQKPDLRWPCHAHQKALADPWAGGSSDGYGPFSAHQEGIFLFLLLHLKSDPQLQAVSAPPYQFTGGSGWGQMTGHVQK